jgi:glutamate transport system permease protein
VSAQPSVLFDAPGPRAARRYRIVAVLSVLGGLALLAWVLRTLRQNGQLTGEKWTPFLTSEIWTAYLLPGLRGTLVAAAVSIVLALTLGGVLGLGRLAETRVIRYVAGVIVEFFRSVPVLLMMIFAYQGYSISDLVPPELIPFAAVVTGLTFYNGAVVAELLRSGVGSLPSGQREAGLALGLTPGRTLRMILAPQAVTAMMPALVSQLVVVLKDSALGYIVTYEELLRKAEQIGTYKVNLIPALIVVAAIFIVINSLLTTAAGRVERRLQRRGTATLPTTTLEADVEVEPRL